MKITWHRAALVSLLLAGLSPLAAADQAQDINKSVFKTCRELHGNLKQQESLLNPLVMAAADIYQVKINLPENALKAAWLIRSGCTLHPDAFLSVIAAKSIRAIGEDHKPVATALFPNADVTLTDCRRYESLSFEEKNAVTARLTKGTLANFNAKTPSYWSDEYVQNIVHNACQLDPGSFVYELIGDLVRNLPASK